MTVLDSVAAAFLVVGGLISGLALAAGPSPAAVSLLASGLVAALVVYATVNKRPSTIPLPARAGR